MRPPESRLDELILAGLFLAGVFLACEGCARPQVCDSLEQLAGVYRANVAKANKGPTAARALARARTLLRREQLPDKAYAALGEALRSYERPPKTIRTGRKPEQWLIKLLQNELTRNERALVTIRRARKRPAGLMPIDLLELAANSDLALDLLKDVNGLWHQLRYAALLNLWNGHPREALEYVLDMITVEKATAGVPAVGVSGWSVRVVCTAEEERTNEAALLVALAGDLGAEDLALLAEALRGTQTDTQAVLRQSLPYLRAWAVCYFDRTEAANPHGIKGSLDSLLPWPGNGARPVPAESELLETIEQLREDRAAYLALLAQYEKALQAPEVALSDVSPRPLGFVGGCLHPRLAAMQRVLRAHRSQRRAAVALLRVLAFRARRSRLPLPDELVLPEDPFRPGERMRYRHDADRGRVGVFALDVTRKAKKGQAELIGYWVALDN